MTEDQAIRKVKGLQKEFFAWVETHPIFEQLDPYHFNDLRKRVFRGTFAAYRLGVVGLTNKPSYLYSYFFGWLEEVMALNTVSPDVRTEVTERCFLTALEAYRYGAMVASE